MKPRSAHNDCPSVATDLKTSDELIKRIRKLRWIGMEEEAHALELAARRSAQISPALTGPIDTD